MLLTMSIISAAFGLSGRIETQSPCPPACATTIQVSFNPQGQNEDRFRYFVGVFPVERGQPSLAMGGYWTGQAWVISQAPASFREGGSDPFTTTVRIPEGICARARSAGFTGQLSVQIGYGKDMLAAQLRDVEAIEQASTDVSGPEGAEMMDMASAFRDLATSDPRMGDVLASQHMRQNGTYRQIGSVMCR